MASDEKNTKEMRLVKEKMNFTPNYQMTLKLRIRQKRYLETGKFSVLIDFDNFHWETAKVFFFAICKNREVFLYSLKLKNSLEKKLFQLRKKKS